MTQPIQPLTWIEAYRMRWKRRRLLWRAYRARHQVKVVQNNTDQIKKSDVLVFAVVRNEAERLPHFLQHYRALGVGHFLIIDNNSDDGSSSILKSQQDVSVWGSEANYRDARFGLDWVSWLLMKYGHGHWCLTVDADELLVYHAEGKDLPHLTKALDGQGLPAMGALMLDVYPKGAIGSQDSPTDPFQTLQWFDAGPYRASRQRPVQNLWVQGGARERVFFADHPQRSPTLNKLPLVKWNRRYAYVNSTHSMLPPIMNSCYDGPGDPRACGVLLHTKFLPSIVSKSETERQRAQHFTHPETFADYYAQIAQTPDLLTDASVFYAGPEQLVRLGLMSSVD